jgi:hypothetical protein
MLPRAVHRNVRGSLFADYVRMIRHRKDVDWGALLEPEDMAYLVARVEPDAWYPMAVFERLGNAIFASLPEATLETVRVWGMVSVDALLPKHPGLVAAGDPIETLMRFRVLRATFFDFEAIAVPELSHGEARIEIDYGMGRSAEEAASHQAMGFFERVLTLAGARRVSASFEEARWLGDGRTVLALRWEE